MLRTPGFPADLPFIFRTRGTFQPTFTKSTLFDFLAFLQVICFLKIFHKPKPRKTVYRAERRGTRPHRTTDGEDSCCSAKAMAQGNLPKQFFHDLTGSQLCFALDQQGDNPNHIHRHGLGAGTTHLKRHQRFLTNALRALVPDHGGALVICDASECSYSCTTSLHVPKERSVQDLRGLRTVRISLLTR